MLGDFFCHVGSAIFISTVMVLVSAVFCEGGVFGAVGCESEHHNMRRVMPQTASAHCRQSELKVWSAKSQ